MFLAQVGFTTITTVAILSDSQVAALLTVNILFAKYAKILLAFPSIILFSYTVSGIFKNFAAKEIGKDTYPPKPNTKSGFSLFNIIIEFIME